MLWVSLLTWTGIGIFVSAQALAQGRTMSPSDLSRLFGSVWLWVPFSLLIVRVAESLPLHRGLRGRTFALHGLSASGLAVIDVAFDTMLDRAFSGHRGFGDRFIAESFINFFSYLAVALAAYASIYRKSAAVEHARTLELENQLSHARLNALIAKLSPHFLFNTLHSVCSLVRFGERDRALQALQELSELLRYRLHADAGNRVPWAQELESAQHYLNIERLRFGDRLTVCIRSPPDLGRASVPTHALQPLVENAIRHGVANRSGPSQLDLQIERASSQLFVTVRESGNEPTAGFQDQTKGFGLGLESLRRRLTYLYPSDEAGVELDIWSSGSRASLRLPWEEHR